MEAPARSTIDVGDLGHLLLGDHLEWQRAFGQAQEELRLLKGTDRQWPAQPKRGDVAAGLLIAVLQLLQS